MTKSMLTLYVMTALSIPTSVAAKSGPVILASPPLYGGPNQAIGACYIFNPGSTAASLTSFQIIDQTGANLSLSNNTCSASLPAGATCFFVANFDGAYPHACVVTLPQKNAAIRASAEIRDSNDVPLNTRDLH